MTAFDRFLFDLRLLNDAVQFIGFFCQSGTVFLVVLVVRVQQHPINISLLDHLTSTPRPVHKLLLYQRSAYDTDGTGRLSTDGQTFASEGDFLYRGLPHF
jgi:hypothetical protein